MKKEILEEQVRKAVRHSVGYLENVYLDNKDEQPITLKNVINYCYKYFIDDQDQVDDFKRNIRFYGKEKVLKLIEEKILQSEDIKLK